MGELYFSLRFLTGKSQGSEIVVPDPAELVVGRSGSVDLLLLDGIVSRRHARFVAKDGTIRVEDLGSANGTFVNGTKVRGSVELAPGDRVLIGATILKLSQSLSAPGTEPTLEVGREEVADPEPSRISGTLTEQGLTKVLETHAADGQDVSIELRLDGVPGFVAIHAGRIWDCGLESLAAGPPVKALFRMLSAPRGEYYVRPGSEPDVPRLDYDVAALLVESKRAGDELDVLRQRLPSAEEAVAMPRPLIAPLVALDEVDLTLLQVAHNQRKVGKIIDASRLVDHEVVRRLLGLIDRGYLRKA